MEAEPYDAIVIGSGQGGTPLSIALAKAGLKTRSSSATTLAALA